MIDKILMMSDEQRGGWVARSGATACSYVPRGTEVEWNTARYLSERPIYTPFLLMCAEDFSSASCARPLDGRSEHGGIEHVWNHTYLTNYTDQSPVWPWVARELI